VKIATAVTKLSELMASGSWIMLLNLPGGSTLQWGMGRGLLCLHRLFLVSVD